MAEKQLEFEFMKNHISNVTSLGYIGGQDEDLGGYCEPLIIEYFDGMNQYVLHAMGQHREGEFDNCKIVNDHKKVLFQSKSELINAWEWVRAHLETNREWNWKKTDSVCGCDATSEEFYKIRRKKIA